jgi:hypothetical protein
VALLRDRAYPWRPSCLSSSSIGRTSVLPRRADGHRDATWMASFRSLAPIRKNPPSCSLVSAKGAVGHRLLAASNPHGAGGLNALECVRDDQVTALPQGLDIGQSSLLRASHSLWDRALSFFSSS